MELLAEKHNGVLPLSLLKEEATFRFVEKGSVNERPTNNLEVCVITYNTQTQNKETHFWYQVDTPSFSLESFDFLKKTHKKLVGSIGRAPDSRLGGRGYICKWLDILVLSDKDYRP